MTKKYLASRQRFARHMDSKIEQNFDKVIRSPFNDYFTHNTEELSNDCIQSIKDTVCENIDLLMREITLEKEEEQKPAKKERKKKQPAAPKVVVEEPEPEEEEEVVVETVSKKKSPKAKKKKSTSDE